MSSHDKKCKSMEWSSGRHGNDNVDNHEMTTLSSSTTTSSSSSHAAVHNAPSRGNKLAIKQSSDKEMEEVASSPPSSSQPSSPSIIPLPPSSSSSSSSSSLSSAANHKEVSEAKKSADKQYSVERNERIAIATSSSTSSSSAAAAADSKNRERQGPRVRVLKQSSLDDRTKENAKSSLIIVDYDKIEKGIARNELQEMSLDDVWDAARSTKRHDDLSNESASPYHRQGVDPDYVFLPFYLKNNTDRRWRSIEEALQKVVDHQTLTPISGTDFTDIIFSYNSANRSKWDFSGLLLYLNDLKGSEPEEISRTLVKMAQLALNIKNIIRQSIPFLKQGQERSIVLSQKQIACLLAHAFFCTYPMRNKDSKGRQVDTGLPLPSINFTGLFRLEGLPSIMLNKLHCIFHYFKRVTSSKNAPQGVVIFKRQSLRGGKKKIDWKKSTTRFKRLHVVSRGRIEEENGLLQVDFANKYVGGGVIGRGCVQEEIRFLISPELIVSRLFTEVLDDDEVLIVTGCETFCQHSGYSDSFKFEGNFNDRTTSKKGLKMTQVVAMDALSFSRSDDNQFDDKPLIRELNKAYCGFLSDHHGAGGLPAVATGNWGCGAFSGDVHLKSLIQLMAAAEAGRDLCYNTHGDRDLVEKMNEVHQLITNHYLSVSEVYNMIINYRERRGTSRYEKLYEKLYDYILNTFQTNFDHEGTPV